MSYRYKNLRNILIAKGPFTYSIKMFLFYLHICVFVCQSDIFGNNNLPIVPVLLRKPGFFTIILTGRSNIFTSLKLLVRILLSENFFKLISLRRRRSSRSPLRSVDEIDPTVLEENLLCFYSKFDIFWLFLPRFWTGKIIMKLCT